MQSNMAAKMTASKLCSFLLCRVNSTIQVAAVPRQILPKVLQCSYSSLNKNGYVHCITRGSRVRHMCQGKGGQGKTGQTDDGQVKADQNKADHAESGQANVDQKGANQSETSPVDSEQNKGDQGESDQSKTGQSESVPPVKKNNILTSIAIFLTGVGATLGYLYYLQTEKDRLKEEKKMKKRKNINVGGPFTLTDQFGNVTTDKDFLGKWHLIYFGFTHCPDICPAEMEKIHEALEMIEKKKKLPEVKPIFISVDPERDDVKTVAEYMKDFHPNMAGLTGTVDQVKDVCKVYRVYFSAGEPDEDNDYIVDHTTIKYLMNPEGKLEDYFGQGSTAQDMAKSIENHIKVYDREKLQK